MNIEEKQKNVESRIREQNFLIPERLKECLKHVGLDQKGLAEKMFISSQGVITEWKNPTSTKYPN